jgi:CRISPR/Cas system-associated exonuclease Cas4 (RecB family)
MMDDERNYHGRRTAEELVTAIFASYEAESDVRSPKRLRCSSIGEECARALMYDYMWVTPPKPFEGRMLALFKTGEHVEAELIADLKRIGWEVIDKDYSNPKRQMAISTARGHLFGYLDGVGRDRSVDGPWSVVECKSMSQKSFNATKRHGVAKEKPAHFAQMQIYMHVMGCEQAVYIFKSKDNDDRWIEIVPYDRSYAERLVEKALMIVDKRLLPPKIASKPDFYKCRFCAHKSVCHEGVAPARNCRTCQHSNPIDGGEWGCAKFNCLLIDRALTEVGCAEYELSEVLSGSIEGVQ